MCVCVCVCVSNPNTHRYLSNQDLPNSQDMVKNKRIFITSQLPRVLPYFLACSHRPLIITSILRVKKLASIRSESLRALQFLPGQKKTVSAGSIAQLGECLSSMHGILGWICRMT